MYFSDENFPNHEQALRRALDVSAEFARQEERNLAAMIEREKRLGLDKKMPTFNHEASMTNQETQAYRGMLLYLKKRATYTMTDKVLLDFLEAWSISTLQHHDPQVALETLIEKARLILRWYKEDIAGSDSAFEEWEARA